MPILEQAAFPASIRHTRHTSDHSTQVASGGSNTFSFGADPLLGGCGGSAGGKSAAEAATADSQRLTTAIGSLCGIVAGSATPSARLHGWRQPRLFFVVQRDGVKLQPVIDQTVAELARDLGLQPLDLLGLEFDHLAGAQIDQMIVMRLRHLFIAGAAVAEIVPLDDAGILE